MICPECGENRRQLKAHIGSRACRSSRVLAAMHARGWEVIGSPKWHRVLLKAGVPCRRVYAFPKGTRSEKGLCPPIEIDYSDLAEAVFAPSWAISALSTAMKFADIPKHWRLTDPHTSPAVRHACVYVLKQVAAFSEQDRMAFVTAVVLGGSGAGVDFIRGELPPLKIRPTRKLR